MPHIVMLRSTETTEFPVPASDGLDTFNADAARLLPAGYELVDVDRKRSVGIARSNELREVTIEDPAGVWSCAPEGWQAISVRPA